MEESLKVAQGISDFGFMVIVCAVFLCLAAALMVACFKWFKSIINDMIKSNQSMVADFWRKPKPKMICVNWHCRGVKTRNAVADKKHIKHLLWPCRWEGLPYNKESALKENHIADREATKAKVHTLIMNMHEDRNSRFDAHSYRGKRLSSYTSPEWIEWVEQCVLSEVYAETVNNGRAYTNVQMVYDRIKIDFYHKLNQEWRYL